MHWAERFGYEQRLNHLGKAVLYDVLPLEVSLQVTPDYKDPARVAEGDFEPVAAGTEWGAKKGRGYFRASARIPDAWKGRRVVVITDTGGEALLFVDGRIHQAMDGARNYAVLAECAAGGEVFDVILETVPVWSRRFERIALACFNREVWDFWVDATLLCQLAMALPAQRPAGSIGRYYYPNAGASRDYQENARGEQIWAALKQAMACVDWSALGQLGGIQNQLFMDYQAPLSPVMDAEASQRLGASVRRAHAGIRGVLGTRGVPGRFRVVTIPNSHLDCAWFWPLRETVRKMARTTANVLRLMEEYPHARFAQSQALLYTYLKTGYPAMFEEVKRRVREGRWLVLGGQWVEADTHLASGESQIRQCLLGQRFYREEFGAPCTAGWLPDIFGLSANMPQLMTGCGLRSLFTIKQITNDDTTFPYSMFQWEGIDGTRLLTNSNVSYYNESMTPGHLLDAQHCFREKHLLDTMLRPFGMGDGGGGPNAFDYETEKRLADVADLPLVDCATRCEQVFEDAARKALPVWRGEIYQGAHRGTYTTMAMLKKLNRQCEQRLRETELLSVIVGQDCRGALQALWQTVCTMQFHDILPGSSVDSVNRDNLAELRRSLAEIVALRDRLARELVEPGKSAATAVFNPHSWTRTDLVLLPGASGANLQPTPEGALALVEAGAFAAAALAPLAPPAAISASERRLENGRFIFDFDAAGRIVALWDKREQRELVKGVGRGLGNELRLHTDLPGPSHHGFGNDGWDMSEFHRDEFVALDSDTAMELVESGPLRATLRVTHRFGNSELTQLISVYAHSERIDFRTRVDWHEHNRMLRARFPVPVNAETAQCEVAFGHVARPTHTNTAWEWSKFEVPCQRWVDVADGGYGVAVLNDCKYGYDVQRGGISLNLLRSTSAPDPTADRGEHEFTYSFLAHTGGPVEAGVVREANALNAPLLAVPGRPRSTASFLTVEPSNVIVETVKQAEEGDGIIVRLYESGNRLTHVRLRGRFNRVTRCNLIEQDDGAAADVSGEWSGSLRPFEIATLRLKIAVR